MMTIRTYSTYSYSNINFVQDNEGNIYNHDSKFEIRYKAVLLTITTPLVTVALAFKSLAKEFLQLKFRNGLESFAHRFKCGVCMTAFAFYALINPYEGRALYGQYELQANRDGPYMTPEVKKQMEDTPGLNRNEKIFRSHEFYLATCAQPIANKGDGHEVLDEYIKIYANQEE